MLVLTAAVLFTLALAAASQSAFGATYALEGAYTTSQAIPICEPNEVCGPSYAYDGSATCQSGCQNAARTGSFTLRLTGQGVFPPSPCVSKRVDGQLDFTPTDPTIPPNPIIAAVGGHNIDYHGYMVKGTITAGALAGFPVSAFVTYPPGPISPELDACSAGTFTGTLDIPPNPI